MPLTLNPSLNSPLVTFPSTTTGMSSTTTAGLQAKSPASNVSQPSLTLPSNQVAPPKPSGNVQTGSPRNGQTASAVNSGLIGNPQALASYTGLQNIGTNESPEVTAARKDLADFQTANADLMGRISQSGYTLQPLTGINANDMAAFGEQLQAKQTALSNALTAQGQQIGALGSAGGMAATQTAPAGSYGISPLTGQPATPGAPIQLSPGNFYVTTNPQTGQAQDVTGGSITPGSGGARQEQVVQGSEGQANKPLLQTANTYAQNLTSLVGSANLNTSDLNAANWLVNVGAQNSSNPLAPRIQATFNGIISQYAQVLGVSPQALASTLTPIAQGLTITDFMNYLSNYAATYNQNVINNSQTNLPSPAPTNVSPTAVTQPNQPQVNEGDTHTYNGVTYRAVNGQWVKQ